MKRILLVIVALALASCAAGSANNSACCYGTEEVAGVMGGRVQRFVDTDFGVVCYVLSSVAISCVPQTVGAE